MKAAVKQILVNPDNYSYVIYSPVSRSAAIVDPGFDASQALYFIEEQRLRLIYVIVTHHHMDHFYSVKHVKKVIPSVLVVASEIDSRRLDVQVDLKVSDGDILKLGEHKLHIILTPGHTKGSICVLVDDDALITGDTLFIGDCGRTDLDDGDAMEMYNTLHEKIMKLPGHVVVYPGHDYGDKPFDTLSNQIKSNKTLRVRSFKEFLSIP
jgi:hydroxyacylglutathione hydrolase